MYQKNVMSEYLYAFRGIMCVFVVNNGGFDCVVEVWEVKFDSNVILTIWNIYMYIYIYIYTSNRYVTLLTNTGIDEFVQG